jgi:solute carrier family 34 (sodium-dependent phosphate cotransporter)
VHLLYNVFSIIVIFVIPVLRPVPLWCAESLARIATERKWLVATYLIVVFIALPAIVIAVAAVVGY